MSIIEISCREVRRELSNYIDEEVSPELRERIERHMQTCHHCVALLDGMNNVLRLVATGEVLQLPSGFSRRLQQRIEAAGETV